MDFNLSDEQTLLKDSVARYLRDNYGFDQRRALIAGEAGYGDYHWSQFAELGWLSIPFGEDLGGMGGGSVETMLLMEEFGRCLVVEPYLTTVVMAGGLLRRAGMMAGREAHIEAIMSGQGKYALAYAEPQARYDLANVKTSATRTDGGYRIGGAKPVVLSGPSADRFIVVARTSGKQADPDGLGLFLVDAGAPGLSRNDYVTVDGLRASDLTFKDVAIAQEDVICTDERAYTLLKQSLDEAIFAVSAEAVGIMEYLYKATVEYSKTRKQFDSPIGQFQALQHRMADMFIETEQARSLLLLAAMREGDRGAGYQQALSALKIKVGTAGRLVGQEAVQLHGGIAMTDELDISHYFKRLTVINNLFGNVDHHVRQFAAADQINEGGSDGKGSRQRH